MTPEIAVSASELAWEHRDPADRLIVATALTHAAEIVSKDDRIRHFGRVLVIW